MYCNFPKFTIEMIGNETGPLLIFVDLSRKSVNKCETYHIWSRYIAAASLKTLCENFNPITSYGKSNMTVFVLSLWEKYRWGLNFFCPICLYILIQPVTMPCSHQLCSPSFKKKNVEANFCCPVCRMRISAWTIKASRTRTLEPRHKKTYFCHM